MQNNTTPRIRTPAKPSPNTPPKPRTTPPTPPPDAKPTTTHTPNHDATCPDPQENDPGRAESNPRTIQPPANIPPSHPKTPYTQYPILGAKPSQRPTSLNQCNIRLSPNSIPIPQNNINPP